MHRALVSVTMLLLVAACGTPQEQCIRAGTRDLQVLDRLIAESRRTVERGYAMEDVEVVDWVWRPCGPPPTGADGKPSGPPPMCMEDVSRTVQRPKAVDLNAERAKLASMEVKRRELDRAAAPVVAACKAQHPE